ncbi:ORM1-like protein 3 [Panicum miliaceum]|uniref:ORM1-like protein 3 n=1 Tax=Panicum miliaceum TaxID=4540 RepID=A0A3L6PMI2_PANMI|nr:ORM1-like protein 3 [Panicum miliaceum]
MRWLVRWRRGCWFNGEAVRAGSAAPGSEQEHGVVNVPFVLFFSWILVLSVVGCAPGTAWTLVNLRHFAITYHLFHWKKGTAFADDQGMYNTLTWWEQMDNGKQLTRNRKFLTAVPVVLFLSYPAWGRSNAKHEADAMCRMSQIK